MFTQTLRRFLRSESGMTLPMLALAFSVMTGLVGSAVDIARVQLVQSKLSFSLDAAGLAAGATVADAAACCSRTQAAHSASVAAEQHPWHPRLPRSTNPSQPFTERQ